MGRGLIVGLLLLGSTLARAQIASVEGPALQAAVVATGEGFALQEVQGALLVSAGSRVAIVRADRVEELRALSAALRRVTRCDVSLGGTFPNGLRAAIQRRPGGNSPHAGGHGVEYRWNGRALRQVRRSARYFELTAIGDHHTLLRANQICNDVREECGSGRMLSSHPPDCPRQPSFQLLAADGSAVVAEQNRSVSTAAALADGTILLASSAGTTFVTRDAPQQHALPGLPNEFNLWVHGLVLVSEREAYLAGEIGPVYDQTPPYLAAFDGSRWRRIDVPFSDGIHALARSPEGTLWLAVGRSKRGELWARHNDGRFVRHPTPGYTPVAIAARGDDDLVIVARKEGCGFPDSCPSVVLMTKGQGKALALRSACR